MAIAIDHHLHYRCGFELVPLGSRKGQWSDVVKLVRDWISKRTEPNDAFWSGWFFAGGEWKPSKGPKAFLKTACAIGNGDERSPQYWSVRFEHPDSTESFRRWSTEIGITASTAGQYYFSLFTNHWLLPGFIGEEPEDPEPSAPNIVHSLLGSKQWMGRAGGDRLYSSVIYVRAGRANEFVDRLMAQDRERTIVLVSQEFQSRKPLVDAARMARLLAGAASVYESESTALDKELEQLLDPDYRCWNGMVRIYQPRIKPGDRTRHRYFVKADVEQVGSLAVEELIVRGVVRRSRLALGAVVTSIEDVMEKQHESKLVALKSSAHSSDELLELFEEENRILTEKVQRKEEEVAYWSNAASELEDDVRRLQYEKTALREQSMGSQAAADALSEQAALLRDLKKLPETVSEIVDLVQRVYPSRIVFTDEARRAAEAAKLRNRDIAWPCLRAMATELYDLHFKELLPLREIAKQFRDKTGFELAVGESEGTKSNKRLKSQRMFRYKAKSVEMSCHVKYGRDPGNSLRVHYYPDAQDKLIVVGHCGDHLDTLRTN